MIEKIGTSFPRSFKIAGFIAIIFGILIILSQILPEFSFEFLIGIPFILGGLIVNFAYYGIEIKKETGKYREYTNILGLTFGKFKNITDYIFVSIIKAEHGYKIYGRSNAGLTVSKKKYDVCFFNKTFKKKVVMKICDTEEEAIEFAKILAIETGLEFSKYNPPRTIIISSSGKILLIDTLTCRSCNQSVSIVAYVSAGASFFFVMIPARRSSIFANVR